MFIRLSSHLNDDRLDAAHVRLPRRVLLHGPAGRVHRGQDARVGRHDDAAREDVAEDEQRHSVGACRGVLVGPAPVDATGGAVRLGPVLPPVGQRGAGEQQGIDPSAGDEQAAMYGVKPVPCEDR